MKTKLLFLSIFLSVNFGWGQLLTQDFSSSTTVSSYVSATPNNGQFNAISTSGAGTVLSINAGKLRFARTGNAGSYSRTTDFSPLPTSLIYKFELTVSGNSAASTNAATFQVGDAFGTANTTETNANTHSRFGINFTTTAGQFSLRDIGGSSNSANFSGTQTITWAINNSGGALNYTAPDGSNEAIADDKWDLWVGTTKVFNDIAATTTTKTLADIKFVLSGGVATIDIDNINIDPIGAVSTPEINLKGNGVSIASGDVTPSVTDDSDFGNVNVSSGTIVKTFTVENLGSGSLALTGASPFVTISGTNASDFSITTIPSTPIAAAGNTTFQITFDPSNSGTRNATISIANDDSNENPYTFAIQGFGQSYIPCGIGALQTIAIQDFEVVPATPTWIYTNTGTAAITTGTAYANGALKDKFIGTRAMEAINSQGIIELNTVDASSYTDTELSFRLGAFGTTNGQGPDGADDVLVSVSTDGGTTWSDEILVSGSTSNNSNWSFTDGTGTASVVYDGNNTTTNFMAGTGSQTTNGYSTVKITNLPSVSLLKIKITADTNATTEIWSIDNIKLEGKAPITKTYTTSNVWSGNGNPPLNTEKVIIEGTLNIGSGAKIDGCECEVKVGGTITVASGGTLEIQSNLTNNGTMTFENSSSLIQHNPVASNTGNITYKRNTTSLKEYDFVYWGAPVANPTLSSIWMTTANDTFYSFDNTAVPQDWLYAAPSTTMDAGKGYISRAVTNTSPVWNPNTAWTANFIGKPNNGNVDFTMVNGGGTNIDNLMSNPYPSAIDLIKFSTDNDNKTKLTGNYYFWTHNTAISGVNTYTNSDYAIYNVNIAAGTGTAGAGSATPTPDQFVDAGQGFFAEASATTGTVTFKNAHRVSGNNNAFYKTNNSNAVQSDKIWLNLSNNSGVFKQQLLAYANDNRATNGFDPNFDSKSFDGNPIVDFYSTIPSTNHKLTIQSKNANSFTDNDIVPLGYKSSIEGDFTIAIDHFDGKFAGKIVYLHDYTLGIDYNLSEKPYTFNTKAGTYNYRFELRYKSYLTNPPETGVIIVNDTQWFKAKSKIKNIKNIVVFDILGKKLLDKTDLNTTEFIATGIRNEQVLIVRITLIDGTLVVKKI